ncbi:hypothetical protein EYF80_024320 [Liparis tanakae]|uniref:Uncharacterized protein n=1 Tax=Liparis tanakae TaxID=230148 RepID=A0A4Z2HIT5_9TELE|nr:hypothetical protein EYF80_024320 [Liparis tanakae]
MLLTPAHCLRKTFPPPSWRLSSCNQLTLSLPGSLQLLIALSDGVTSALDSGHLYLVPQVSMSVLNKGTSAAPRRVRIVSDECGNQCSVGTKES